MRGSLAAGSGCRNLCRMQVTILGGGGFLGRKLAERLARDPRLRGLTLFDIAAPSAPQAPGPVTCLAGNVTDPAALAAAIPEGTTHVVHLAAVVSAAAEADWALGPSGHSRPVRRAKSKTDDRRAASRRERDPWYREPG